MRYPRLALLGLVWLLVACSSGPAPSPPANNVTPAPPTATAPPTGIVLPTQANTPNLTGRIVFSRYNNLALLENGKVRPLTNSTEGRSSRDPSWSPDGKRLLYTERHDSYSDLVILVDIQTGEARRLTDNQCEPIPGRDDTISACAWALQPTWAPDGKSIVYVADQRGRDGAGGTPTLWQIEPDSDRLKPASPLLKRLALPENYNAQSLAQPSWNAKGDLLAFTVYDKGGGGGSQVWKLTLTRTGPTAEQPLTPGDIGAYDPRWAPRGAFLTVAMRQGSRSDLWLVPTDGSAPVQITRDGASRQPVWSPDGKWLAYVSQSKDPAGNQRKGSFDLWAIPVEWSGDAPKFGAPQPITDEQHIDATSSLSWADAR